jgi:tetratricopeptide (TPR) repeat protein
MANLLRRLFTRKHYRDPATVIEELWKPTFRSEHKARFQAENSHSVKADVAHGVLELTLKKKNVFGWAENPWYRYRDFALEAHIAPDPANGHSSAGVLIRRADERNYYYFLISGDGHYRFDVVFNGNPRTLIGWTACPAPADEMAIRVIARGAYFGFYLEDEWIGEVEDDTIDVGAITLAAQNYDDRETATYRLLDLTVDSRPYEVETQYYRWRRYVPVDRRQRLVLARSFASSADFSRAVVQFSLAGVNLSVEDLLMYGECQVRCGLRNEAMTTVDRVLEFDDENRVALAEKANLLYLDNRIIELRDLLVSHPSLLDGNAVMWNLLGNAWYALGNRAEAATAYDKASEIDPTLAMYRINGARCHEFVGERENALNGYLEAAKMLFREEDYVELSGLLPHVERLAPGNPEVLALQGKIAFGEGRYGDADESLAKVIEAGSVDSSVYYLYGILLAQRGERPEANECLERATQLEPDYYLYWFRLGESRHISGEDAETAVLRALELAPDDMWVLNLAGLIHLENQRDEASLALLAGAYGQAEGSDDSDSTEFDDIIANYSEALFRTGDRDRAYELLRSRTETAPLLNQLGNLHSRDGDFESAAAAYERAVRIAPGDKTILMNCAAACIESDRVLRAEEILARILEDEHDSGAYNLMGNAALIKGEYARADAAYCEALKADPANKDAAINLACLQADRSEYEDARTTITKHLSGIDTPRLAAVRERVRHETELEIVCCRCERVWKVDKNIADQPPLRLRGELPDESPAGQCPQCGNVYCISCAKATLSEGRFQCADCGESLKLSSEHIKLIVARYVP